jgi:hypothetical protein
MNEPGHYSNPHLTQAARSSRARHGARVYAAGVDRGQARRSPKTIKGVRAARRVRRGPASGSGARREDTARPLGLFCGDAYPRVLRRLGT